MIREVTGRKRVDFECSGSQKEWRVENVLEYDLHPDPADEECRSGPRIVQSRFQGGIEWI